MGQPLELGYQWRPPVVVATVGLVAFVGLVVRTRAPGWGTVVAVLVLGWAAFAAVVWLRTRAYLEVDGPVIITRRFRDFVRIEGAQVTAVQQFPTPHGPSYRLTVAEPGGPPVRRIVPVALLRRGHVTLFTWLAEWAPGATLDKGSRRTRDELRRRELIT